MYSSVCLVQDYQLTARFPPTFSPPRAYETWQEVHREVHEFTPSDQNLYVKFQSGTKGLAAGTTLLSPVGFAVRLHFSDVVLAHKKVMNIAPASTTVIPSMGLKGSKPGVGSKSVPGLGMATTYRNPSYETPQAADQDLQLRRRRLLPAPLHWRLGR